MTFSRDQFPQEPGCKLSEDRFREVEMATSFKMMICQSCGFKAIYKYRVKQIRRKEEIVSSREDELREDHIHIWNSIPRFAELPETLCCKRCAEILPQETFCVF